LKEIRNNKKPSELRTDSGTLLNEKIPFLAQAMFLETNPIPVKTALGLMGKITPELRLPLYQMSETNLNKLKEILQNYSLI